MAITIEGLDGVLEAIQNIGNVEQLENALTKSCMIVERAAKQKAVKVFGELRRSITSEVKDSGNTIEGIVYTPLEYAPYVEYGTGLFAENGNGRKEVPWVYVEGSTQTSSNKKTYTDAEADQTVAYLRSKGLEAYKTSGQQPQPFMRPALNESREQILNILKESLDNE